MHTMKQDSTLLRSPFARYASPLTLALSAALAPACGASGEASWEEDAMEGSVEKGEESSVTDNALVAGSNGLRLPPANQTRFTLSACFYSHPPHLNGTAAVVRQAAADSWETAAGITFDWQDGDCEGNEDIRFGLSDDPADGISHADFIGSPEVFINIMSGATASPTLCRTSEAQWNRCIASTAAHEIGHSLGFAHEHEHEDWTNCADGSIAPVTGGSDLSMGFVDADSVMSYCYSRRVGRANLLTASDADWAGRLYGNGSAVEPGRWYAARSVSSGGYLRLGRTFYSAYGDIIAPEWRPRVAGESSWRRNVIQFRKKSGGGPIQYGDLVSIYDNTRQMYICTEDVYTYGPLITGRANECFWQVQKLDNAADGTVRVHEPIRLRSEYPVGDNYLNLESFRLLGHFDQNLDNQ